MLVSVKMVLLSQLSDLQEPGRPKQSEVLALNWCKYLLMRYTDLTTEIDADDIWCEFEFDMKKTGRSV